MKWDMIKKRILAAALAAALAVTSFEGTEAYAYAESTQKAEISLEEKAENPEPGLGEKEESTEIKTALEGKAEGEEIREALEGKAEGEEIREALEGKAEGEEIREALEGKTESTEIKDSLEGKVESAEPGEALGEMAEDPGMEQAEAKAPETLAGAEALAGEGVQAREGAIALNTRVDGTIESADDEDVYVIAPPAGTDLFYDFVFTNAGDFRMDITLSSDEYFAGSSILSEELGSKANGRWNLQKKLAGGQTYYLRVKCHDGRWTQTAPYYFWVNTVADDAKDTVQEAEAVSLDQRVGKAVQNKYDEDFFQFTTTSNPDTFYSLSFTNAGTEGNMYFTVYEDELFVNKFPEVGVGSGESTTQNLSKLLPGHTYYVKVRYSIFGDFISKEMPYFFQVNSSADDVLDDVGHATAIQVKQRVSKALQNKNDVDIFRFTTPDTDSFYWYEFTNVSSKATMHYAIFDNPELAGAPIQQDWFSSKQSQSYEFGKLKRNYTYYLKVEHGTYSDADNISQDEYTFMMTSLLDDVNNKINNGDDSIKNVRSLGIGKSITAGIQSSSDEDYFKFTTTKDENFYELAMSNKGDFQMNIQIWDNNDFVGEKVLDDNVYGKRSETFNLAKLEKNHTYYVRIAKYGTFIKEGKYTLKLTAAKDDVKDSIGSAKSVKLNETKTYGIQNPKDEDWFKFKTSVYGSYRINFSNLTKDTSYTITIYDNKDAITNRTVLNVACYGKQSISPYYAVQKLKPLKTYYVKVSGGQKGKYKFGVDAAGPGAPKIKGTKLSWKPVSKATGYMVYRSEKGNSAKYYKKIATVKGSKLSYTDKKKPKKGKVFYYKVRAYRKSKGKTYYSQYSSAKSVRGK